jgi:hypothetical protein
MAQPDATPLAPPEAIPQRELRLLDQLLGDTRVRYRHRLTPFAASERLFDLDKEISIALAKVPSPELELEARRLIDRLRALDPH